jgi:hypothetical protein
MLAVRREQERRVLNSESREDVGEFWVAANACPSARGAAVQLVLDQRVCAEVEQCGDRFALSRLRRDVDRGDAFAVARAAERAALIRVGAQLDTRFTYEWINQLGIYRLDGTFRPTRAYASR